VVSPPTETPTQAPTIEVAGLTTASILVNEVPIRAPRVVRGGSEQRKHEVAVLSEIAAR
jgi:hypothetical protein